MLFATNDFNQTGILDNGLSQPIALTEDGHHMVEQNPVLVEQSRERLVTAANESFQQVQRLVRVCALRQESDRRGKQFGWKTRTKLLQVATSAAIIAEGSGFGQ